MSCFLQLCCCSVFIKHEYTFRYYLTNANRKCIVGSVNKTVVAHTSSYKMKAITLQVKMYHGYLCWVFERATLANHGCHLALSPGEFKILLWKYSDVAIASLKKIHWLCVGFGDIDIVFK